MIKNKKDLRYYLSEDYGRISGGVKLKDWILHNEKWFIHKYLVALRHVEYYINTNNKGLRFLYWWFRYKRLGFKLRLTVYPNTTGAGLSIPHTGDFIWVKASCKIGNNCTLRPGCVIGKKSDEDVWDAPVNIGDNCILGLGVRILGKINIGDNVVIGANSVVLHDIPDNAIVGGIPAKIIK